MNKIHLTGRLVADPELRYTQGGKANASFKMAVKRGFKNAEGNYEADFIPCVVWEKKAEVISEHVKKGHQFGVSGRIQVRTYDNKDGQKVWMTEVVVEDFDFLESKRDSAGNPPATPSRNLGKEVNVDDQPF